MDKFIGIGSVYGGKNAANGFSADWRRVAALSFDNSQWYVEYEKFGVPGRQKCTKKTFLDWAKYIIDINNIMEEK